MTLFTVRLINDAGRALDMTALGRTGTAAASFAVRQAKLIYGGTWYAAYTLEAF